MSYTPSVVKMHGVNCKVAVNWKLVQVSEMDAVSICMYDANYNRIYETSVVKAVKRSDPDKGSFARTESGTLYFLADDEKNKSLWPIGLQAKRPGVFSRLQAKRIL